MIIGWVNDSKHDVRTAIRTATFSKGNGAQKLLRDSSCATLPFAVLVLRYLIYCDHPIMLQFVIHDISLNIVVLER